ncbi:MAG: hypothetical protein HY718_17555 [Planctomycetes bacterium]|nr:hypothetical protein [Planctomycetota bacterium]
MDRDELLKVLKQRPFEPFSLYMSEGASYAVKHPDPIIVTPRAAYVGLGGNGGGPAADQVVICSLIHITRLRPLPEQTRAG